MFNLARNGNLKREFEERLLEHIDSLYNVALRMVQNRQDAEDLVQETALRAYRYFDKFKQGTNFKAWIITILRNIFINEYRKRMKEPQMTDFEEDFKIMVPDLSSQNVDLLGARICSLKNKKSAYITYEKGGHGISVFMFDAKKLKFPIAKKVVVNNKHFYLSKERGFNSALWIDEGIACVFVSDLDEAELLYLASL